MDNQELTASFNGFTISASSPNSTSDSCAIASAATTTCETTNEHANIEVIEEPDWRLSEPTLGGKWDFVLEHGRYSDLTCFVGRKRVPVKCHSLVLKLQSQPFAAKYGEFPCTEQNPLSVEMPWIEPEPFRCFLRYLYSEHCDFGVEDAVSVLKAARDFDIAPLVKICTDRIHGGIRAQNAAWIYEKSHEYGEEGLKKQANEYILEHARVVFASAGFLQLSKHSIGELLESRSPERYMTEVEAFHALLRWGCAEYQRECGDFGSGHNTELTEEFLLSISDELRDILSPAIDHIDFKQFTHQEFTMFVAKRKVLPQNRALEILMDLSMTGAAGKSLTSPSLSLNLPPQPAGPLEAGAELTLVRYKQMIDNSDAFWHTETETDRISFKVDKGLEITGLGLYGSSEGRTSPPVDVEVKIASHDDESSVVGQFKGQMELPSESGVFRVEFTEPVPVEPEIKYTVEVTIHGPVKPYGVGGIKQYAIGDNAAGGDIVNWEFMNAKGQIGYKLSHGQMPEIHFLII